MRHLGTKIIETKRLVLRRFVLEDAEGMYQNWAKDPEVTKYLTWPAHQNMDITKQVLSDWAAGYQQKDVYNWCIVLKETGEPIGNISVVHINESVQSMEIGYCISRACWHQGITTEACKAVMKYLLEEVGVSRIECKHDTRNPNSGKVMLSCGLKYEGTRIKADRNNSGIIGHVISDETIDNIGILAKLELSDAEREQAKSDMGEMLDYIDQLNELDTSGVEPMPYMFPVTNVFREDIAANTDGSMDALANAPALKDGGFKVPKTIG